MAIGAILAAREAGLRVPDDLSVVGVDGHDLASFFGLTTIDQFPERQGARAAAAMLAAVGAAPAAAGGELEFTLVERTSTAPPAGPA